MYHEIILYDEIDNYFYKTKNYKKKHEENKEQPSHLIKKGGQVYSEECINNMKRISGIYNNTEKFQQHIDKLIPGSFGLWCEFELQYPYFSRDNDELNIIQNPILKENISKIPMIGASSWKGILSLVALDKLKEKVEYKKIEDLISYYLSFSRIFGTGSKDFRKVGEELERINNKIDDDIDNSKLIEELIKYCVYELCININIKKDGTRIYKQLIDQIKSNKCKANNIFSVKRGRAIFYPTYFNRISYEVINPHNRKTRTGKNPIMYEVIPKGTRGIFQLIYIPYDDILTKRTNLEKEINYDIEFIEDILRDVLEYAGIGAKTKLGWGRGNIDKNGIKCFKVSWGEYNE